MLLGQESVRKELKLSDEQIKKLDELSAKQREGFEGLRDASREQRREKFAELAKTGREAVNAILTEEQRTRYRQIGLQVRGLSALGDDEVAQSLSLTDEQKKKVEEIQQASREEMRGLFQGGGGGDRAEMRKKFEEARKAVDEKLGAVLTPEQQAKWKELTGPKFEGQLQGPGQGGRRGRRNRDNASTASETPTVLTADREEGKKEDNKAKADKKSDGKEKAKKERKTRGKHAAHGRTRPGRHREHARHGDLGRHRHHAHRHHGDRGHHRHVAGREVASREGHRRHHGPHFAQHFARHSHFARHRHPGHDRFHAAFHGRSHGHHGQRFAAHRHGHPGHYARHHFAGHGSHRPAWHGHGDRPFGERTFHHRFHGPGRPGDHARGFASRQQSGHGAFHLASRMMWGPHAAAGAHLASHGRHHVRGEQGDRDHRRGHLRMATFHKEGGKEKAKSDSKGQCDAKKHGVKKHGDKQKHHGKKHHAKKPAGKDGRDHKDHDKKHGDRREKDSKKESKSDRDDN